MGMTAVQQRQLAGGINATRAFMISWKAARKATWTLAADVMVHSQWPKGVGGRCRNRQNIPYYPDGLQITAVDLTPSMLEQAKVRAQELGKSGQLDLGDVQRLDFADQSFDSVAATFVFCSVPNPVLGLPEIRRVLKSGGTLFLLEHMRSEQPVVARIMDWLDPLVVRMMGANINRRTVDNVRRSGLEIVQIEELSGRGIFKRIIARRPEDPTIL